MAAGAEHSQLQRAARTTFGRLPSGAEPRRARRSGALGIPGLSPRGSCLREVAGSSGKDAGSSGKDAEGRERGCGRCRAGQRSRQLASSGAEASPPAAPVPRFHHTDTTLTARAKRGMTECCFLPLCRPLALPQEAQGSSR